MKNEKKLCGREREREWKICSLLLWAYGIILNLRMAQTIWMTFSLFDVQQHELRMCANGLLVGCSTFLSLSIHFIVFDFSFSSFSSYFHSLGSRWVWSYDTLCSKHVRQQRRIIFIHKLRINILCLCCKCFWYRNERRIERIFYQIHNNNASEIFISICLYFP